MARFPQALSRHTWGPEHRSLYGRLVRVCAVCGIVKERLWSYGDDGWRTAYRRKDGTFVSSQAPTCEPTHSERTTQ